jgi:hypothetical protein
MDMAQFDFNAPSFSRQSMLFAAPAEQDVDMVLESGLDNSNNLDNARNTQKQSNVAVVGDRTSWMSWEDRVGSFADKSQKKSAGGSGGGGFKALFGCGGRSTQGRALKA